MKFGKQTNVSYLVQTPSTNCGNQLISLHFTFSEWYWS